MSKVINFKNAELKNISDFLFKLKLTGRASRGRNKVLVEMEHKAETFYNDLQELKEEVYQKNNETGKSELKGDFTKEDVDKKANEIGQDMAGVNVEEFSDKIKALYQALDKYEEPFEGLDAVCYDRIMDLLEEIEL
ncbi:hypothetical protein [Ligilactobacillus agilis]|uniref:hypothetical protein n=1 Tax=Ligilactobacillus agilis TaxID=1601 RepID=UPI003209CEE3